MSTRLFVTSLVLAVCAACHTYESHHAASVDTSSILWRYYPDARVYYSSSHNRYWYFANHEQVWMEAIGGLPPQITLRGEAVEVGDRSREPWHDEPAHIAAYRQYLSEQQGQAQGQPPPGQPGAPPSQPGAPPR